MDYVQSEELKKILNAKSCHGSELQAAEYQQQERYFDPLSCLQSKYTYFKPADRCVEEKHELQWHDATKRFFKCPCGQRAIALDRLPHKHCRTSQGSCCSLEVTSSPSSSTACSSPQSLTVTFIIAFII
uniref:Replication factor Mcm10 C-terminal domain-containing protein n=1 Tax=Hucho hucho TaxID=62062 RepID=A0A4W5RW27_9TELE